MSIGQVMIHVSSLETAKKFYIDILGLKIKTDLTNELGMLILENDGCFFTLHQGFKKIDTSFKDCKTVIILKVNNIQETKKLLEASQINLSGGIVETPVHYYQALQDYDGNWLEVAEFK